MKTHQLKATQLLALSLFKVNPMSIIEENKKFTRTAKLIAGLYGAIILGIVYLYYIGHYFETGKQSDLMTAEVNIDYSERIKTFRVTVLDKEFRNEFDCKAKPIKIRAVLTYRMVEVETLNGKSKTVPKFDAELSCKAITASFP